MQRSNKFPLDWYLQYGLNGFLTVTVHIVVVPKLVRAVTQIKVAIISYYLQ